MITPVPRRAVHPEAAPAAQEGQLDAVLQRVLERAARPRLGSDAAPRPAMNRQERVALTVYAVMAVLVVAFLVATGVLWWLAA